jgi:hypothetical protein
MYKSEIQNLCCSLKYLNPLWEPCSLLFKRYFSSLRGLKQSVREADRSPFLLQRLRMNRAVPLNRLYDFMAWTETA